MKKTSKIFVAGHRGLVGSAIVEVLRERGYSSLLLKTRDELDLRDPRAVSCWMVKERPDYIILAAAKVGGILANNSYPAEFIHDNLLIETSVIHAALEIGASRLLLLGSSCIYPKFAPQPLREGSLLSGMLEPTNRPYAVAKIAGIEMCWAYNRQYGTRFLAAMPTNLYGVGDNYHPTNSHVIPSLLRRFHEAKISGSKSVAVWGTGNARREFLFNADAADACVFLLELPDDQYCSLVSSKDEPPLVNIGFGEDLTIRELAELIKDVVGFQGHLEFDHERPDGTPRKLLDSGRLRELGWRPKTDMVQGLKTAYRDFLRRSEVAVSEELR